LVGKEDGEIMKYLTDDELDHFIATKIMGWRRGEFEEFGVNKSIEYRLVFKENGLKWCDTERDHYLVSCAELPAGGWDTNEIWSPSTNLNHTHIAEEKFLHNAPDFPDKNFICDQYLENLYGRNDYWVVCASARSRSEALYETFLEQNHK